jgi:hypothetical protein
VGPTIVALGLVGIVLPVVLAWHVLVGSLKGSADPVGESLLIAQQATDVTKYLLTLATGIVGLVGFLMSEKLTTYWKSLTASRRRWVILGAFLALISVWTGLVTLWTILDLTTMRLVRNQLDLVMWLHVIDVMELSLGVFVICGAVIPVVLAQDGR